MPSAWQLFCAYTSASGAYFWGNSRSPSCIAKSGMEGFIASEDRFSLMFRSASAGYHLATAGRTMYPGAAGQQSHQVHQRRQFHSYCVSVRETYQKKKINGNISIKLTSSGWELFLWTRCACRGSWFRAFGDEASQESFSINITLANALASGIILIGYYNLHWRYV